MFPSNIQTSLIIKHSDFNTVEQLIQSNWILSILNINSCSISSIPSIKFCRSTVPILDTTVDLLITNIVWNNHFFTTTDISWEQLIIDHRLRSMSSYLHLFQDPLFICDFYNFQIFTFNSDIIGFHYNVPNYSIKSNFSYFYANIYGTDVSSILPFAFNIAKDRKHLFDLVSFFVNHHFISTDLDLLFTFYNIYPKEFLVIPNSSFRFKSYFNINISNSLCYGLLSPIVISLQLPNIESIHLALNNFYGFIPPIKHLAILAYDNTYPGFTSVVVVFKFFKSEFTDTLRKAIDLHSTNFIINYDNIWVFKY